MEIDLAEREYRWLDAAKAYEQALQSKPDSAAELWARIGFCYQRASNQTETVEDTKRLLQQSAEAYEKAAELFGKEEQGKRLQCLVIAAHARSRVAINFAEKFAMLNKYLALGKRALEAFKIAGDELNYAKICSHLSEDLVTVALMDFGVERGEVPRAAIGYADEAVALFSKLGQKAELLSALIPAGILTWTLAMAVVDKTEMRNHVEKKCVSYSKRAMELSSEVEDPSLKAWANILRGISSLFFEGKIFETLDYCKEALQQVYRIKDNNARGAALWVLGFAAFRISEQEVDMDKGKQLAEEAIRYSGE